MAVLVEAISVIVRCDSVARRFPGGHEAFATDCLGHNKTYCSDDELCRLGFMAPDDCRRFVERMRRYGLIYVRDGRAIDLVVMDQQRGPLMPCTWAEFGTITLDAVRGAKAAFARLVGSQLKIFVMPEGWSFDGSLTESFGFVPDGQKDKMLELLEDQDGLEIYLNRATGEKVYIGRQRS